MKRITSMLFMLAFLAFSSFACNNVDNKSTVGDTENTSPATNVTTGGSNPDGTKTGDLKPEFLTLETFKEKIWDFEANPEEWKYEGTGPAIIDFYADWCKPCKMVAPILAEISKDYAGRVKVYKIDTQKEKELAAVFQVSSIPTFLYIPAEGQPQMDRGYKDKAAFERIIKEVLLKQ